MSPTLVILLTASIIAASCALVGSFLVLRKMALLGDAISHAVLPGIVVAFLVSGSRSPLPMLIGAASLGMLTVLLVELAARTRRLREDTSIGVVFPALFAIGVILISRYAGQVDLDLDCVLYGEIAYAPWDLMYIGERPIGPRALWIGGSVLLLDLVLVTLFYKELKLTTFDPQLAAALGFAPAAVHYLLMVLVSITVVGAFESVGAILVVAMLVVPPATAYLLTERLSRMLLLSIALGIASALIGYGLARIWDASIAGAMASVSGVLFLTTFLLSPRHGLAAKLWRRRKLGRAMSEQLLMLHLSHAGPALPLPEIANRFAWRPRLLEQTARRLEAKGWLAGDDDGLRLTVEGRAALDESGRQPLRHKPA